MKFRIPSFPLSYHYCTRNSYLISQRLDGYPGLVFPMTRAHSAAASIWGTFDQNLPSLVEELFTWRNYLANDASASPFWTLLACRFRWSAHPDAMFNGRAHSMVQLFHNLTWFETLADFFSFAQVHCGAACVRKWVKTCFPSAPKALLTRVTTGAHQGLESRCDAGKTALAWLFGTFFCFLLSIF